MDAKTTESDNNKENINPNDRHQVINDKSEFSSVGVRKIRKSKVPKPGDIIVVPVDLMTVSPAKAKKLMPKKPRSEKQKANDERLRGVQKEKKIDSDAKKKLVLIAEQKLLDETKTVKLKILPKRVNKPKKVADYVADVLKKEQSESSTDSDDEEIKTLKKHVKKVSIKKELYDQLNNIKLDTMRSKTPNKYEGLMNAMFR